VNCSREATGYVRFVDGKWQPIYTTCSGEEKTTKTGENNQMPCWLSAALVTDLGTYMNELETPWRSMHFKKYSLNPELYTVPSN
jgi:hypothetical protein